MAPDVRRTDLAELRCTKAMGELFLKDSCFTVVADAITTTDRAVYIVCS